MNITEIKSNILRGKYDSDFNMLYGEAGNARSRYSAACESFQSLFPETEDIRLFTAPGRTEIGGNHTDHQHGCVLAGSVNLSLCSTYFL